jgi:hypothetical protein
MKSDNVDRTVGDPRSVNCDKTPKGLLKSSSVILSLYRSAAAMSPDACRRLVGSASQTHPDLRVEIITSHALQNLITDGVDVAIRLGVEPLDASCFGALPPAPVQMPEAPVRTVGARILVGRAVRPGRTRGSVDRMTPR